MVCTIGFMVVENCDGGGSSYEVMVYGDEEDVGVCR